MERRVWRLRRLDVESPIEDFIMADQSSTLARSGVGSKRNEPGTIYLGFAGRIAPLPDYMSSRGDNLSGDNHWRYINNSNNTHCAVVVLQRRWAHQSVWSSSIATATTVAVKARMGRPRERQRSLLQCDVYVRSAGDASAKPQPNLYKRRRSLCPPKCRGYVTT